MQIKYSVLLLFFCAVFHVKAKKESSFIVMINPGGAIHNSGRMIDDTFEQGITLQFSEKLQHYFNTTKNNITIVLTREPGKKIGVLDNASFANRLGVDLFLSIHFYKETEIKPHAYIYQLSYNDDFISFGSGIHVIPYDHAHIINKIQTTNYVSQFKNILTQSSYEPLFLTDAHKIPFKPLIGIAAPSIGIEIGLKKADDWNLYIQPLVDSIQACVQS